MAYRPPLLLSFTRVPSDSKGEKVELVFCVALVAKHALVGCELSHRPIVVGSLCLRHPYGLGANCAEPGRRVSVPDTGR